MRKKFWFFIIVILLLVSSNLFTYFHASYSCSLKYVDLYHLVKDDNNEKIFGFLIVPDNGKWSAEMAKAWLKKPKNTEWKEEVTDRFFVTWSPETVNHVAYGFRLEGLDEEHSYSQLVSR